MSNRYLEEFCASYNLQNLIKEPTCIKNLQNPACINHILTNHPKGFHSSSVFDFHKLTLTVLKVFHAKHKPKIIQCRDSITLITHHLEQMFFRSYLFNLFTLENLKNLNTFTRKYLILMLQ